MMSVVRTGRTVEWLVWQVATAADDELGPMYREDTVIPFAIDLDVAAAVPAAADAAGAPRRHRLTSRSLQPVTRPGPGSDERSPAGGRPPATGTLTASEVRTLRAWTSLAQWVGTERGLQAVERVEETWPGYGQVAASSILNAYYTDTDVVLTRVGLAANATASPTGSGSSRAAAAATGSPPHPTRVRFDAVDIDPISVKVASALTGANVVESRIEEWHLGRSDQALANGGYDVVVGNVPFSSHKPGVGNPHRDNLHNLADRPVGGDAAPRRCRRGAHVTVLAGLQRHVVAAPAGRRGRPGRRVPAAVTHPPRGRHRRRHRPADPAPPTAGRAAARRRTGWTSSSSPWTPTPPPPSTATGPTTPTMSSAGSSRAGRTAGRTSTSSPTGPPTTALADALAAVELRWAPTGTAPAVDDPAPVAVAHRAGPAVAGRVDRRSTRRRRPGSPVTVASIRARPRTATSCSCW